MIMLRTIKRLARNERGATAIEFALYATMFFGLLFGGFYASLLGYTTASLHEAVESAARCRSMGITCTDATTTQTYASHAFHNVTPATPTFVSSKVACGNQVTGTMDYNLQWIVSSSTIHLSASSCFP